MTQPAGRLFWKLFAALWLATLLSFTAVRGYYTFIGALPPEPPPGFNPWTPWLTGVSVSIIFSATVAWYLSGPLRHLRWGLRRAAEERFDTRLTPLMGRRRDEIVDLATEFDAMAVRLQQLTATRRALLHDLSHELRSPLARMQAAVGLWRQAPDDGAQLAERVASEVGRLDALVGELLTLHRLESAHGPGGEPLERETIDLRDVLETIAADASFEAQASGCDVVLDAGERFVARVNGDLVYRAIENVVRNAVRYAPKGSRVEISARGLAAPTRLRIVVADRGPGVPTDKLEAIFEPFVRIDGNASSRSTGLGLALARRAVTSHGGRIQAQLRPGGGLLVEIDVPEGMT